MGGSRISLVEQHSAISGQPKNIAADYADERGSRRVGANFTNGQETQYYSLVSR
jgi:hypothetical protein